MNRRNLKLSMMALGLFVLGVQLSNCAPEPKYRTPALGEVVQIPPIAVNEPAKQYVATTAAVKLSVMWGGRAISSDQGNPRLYFYDESGAEIHSESWASLERAYRRGSCSESMVSSLDGYLAGVALICDGRLDFNQVARIRAINEDGSVREAEIWGAHSVSEEVTSVSIGLY